MLRQYNYHPELTKRLDRLTTEEFDAEALYEIVLWKLSRYPYVERSLIEDLKTVAAIPPGAHREANDLLGRLLRSPGIRLPMASTILRFLNPSTFQIIDDRAYRVLLPGCPMFPAKPAAISRRYIDRSTDIYFRYLDKLRQVCSERLPFEVADRILYQLDIQLGNKIGDRLPE